MNLSTRVKKLEQADPDRPTKCVFLPIGLAENKRADWIENYCREHGIADDDNLQVISWLPVAG